MIRPALVRLTRELNASAGDNPRRLEAGRRVPVIGEYGPNSECWIVDIDGQATAIGKEHCAEVAQADPGGAP